MVPGIGISSLDDNQSNQHTLSLSAKDNAGSVPSSSSNRMRFKEQKGL